MGSLLNERNPSGSILIQGDKYRVLLLSHVKASIVVYILVHYLVALSQRHRPCQQKKGKKQGEQSFFSMVVYL